MTTSNQAACEAAHLAIMPTQWEQLDFVHDAEEIKMGNYAYLSGSCDAQKQSYICMLDDDYYERRRQEIAEERQRQREIQDEIDRRVVEEDRLRKQQRDDDYAERQRQQRDDDKRNA